jgi:hypothetical protein
MSKIPPGEWSAIAARHAKGESLSAIARSYGCTPPAIHYVLKRNGRVPIEPAERVEQPAEATPSPSNATPLKTPPQILRVNGETKLLPNRESELTAKGSPEPDLPASAPVRSGERLETSSQTLQLNGQTKPLPNRENEPTARGSREPDLPASAPARSEEPAGELHPLPGYSRTTGRALGSNDGLDSELYGRAEAAIQTFRSCFDAALAEGSPHDRARLRQAASDLMRVAARTTIVLDRLNALSERAAARFDPRPNRNWPS